jgi:integrase
MKLKFRLYRRACSGRFYVQDNETGKQESLGTSDRAEAHRLLHVRNEAAHQPAMNLQSARAYLAAGDPAMATRTWQTVMDASKRGSTRGRYERAIKERAFDALRPIAVLQTRPEHFFQVLSAGTVSTNDNLRRFHNFALSMTWLPWPVLTKTQWPPLRYRDKRGITWEEHQKIVESEKNPEKKAFFELAWHLGASQLDLASLTTENIDWLLQVLSYQRRKTGSLAVQRFGAEVAAILRQLPQAGPLLPTWSKISSSDRAARFANICKRLGIAGVSLHSYRYGWAERAKTAGYPERFAQEALGHKSRAVHRAYAKQAVVTLPALEDFEKQQAKLVMMPKAVESPPRSVDAGR